MTKKVSAAEAKRRFSELVSRVQYRGDRVLIEKRGKPAAAIVNVKDLETLTRTDPNKRGSILDCAGLFGDIPEFESIMKEVIASRRTDRPRKVRIP